MTRLLSLAGFVLLAMSSVGCVSNSSGLYRGKPVTKESPIVRWRELTREAQSKQLTYSQRALMLAKADSIEQEALHNLEDIVEPAATKVLGMKIDLCTPQLKADNGNVKFFNRKTNGWDEVNLDPHEGVELPAIKYLADHVGPELLNEALAQPEAKAISHSLVSYLESTLPLAKAKTLLRAQEKKLYQKLGVTLKEAKQNELVLDATAGGTRGYVSFSDPHLIRLDRGCVGRSPLSRVMNTYGHEIVHVLANKSYTLFEKVASSLGLAWWEPSRTQDQIRIEETTADEVGSMIAKEWSESNSSENLYTEEDISRKHVTRSHGELRHLYYHPKVTFSAFIRMKKRYSRIKHPRDPTSLRSKIRVIMGRIGPVAHIRLLRRYETMGQLDGIYRRCKMFPTYTAKDAEALLESPSK